MAKCYLEIKENSQCALFRNIGIDNIKTKNIIKLTQYPSIIHLIFIQQ